MSALPASAPPAEAAGSGGTVWCRGMNWLGDSVMTLPALAAYRRAWLRPETSLALLAGE